MTVSKTRGAARKGAHKDLRFGHKLANIQFGKEKTIFAVHEDLLCSSSKYFKRKLQQSRKPVEGDCSVCTEDIAGLTQISYCKGCGQNFHTKCIDDWLQRERTCPLCRLEWSIILQPTEVTVSCTLSTSRPDTRFGEYMQWLYTREIAKQKDLPFISLSPQAVAEELDDPDYLLATRRGILQKCVASQAKFTEGQIVTLYKGPQWSKGRKFVVALCAAKPSLVELTSNLPVQFLLDLTQELLSNRPVEGVDLYQAMAEYVSSGEEDQELSED